MELERKKRRGKEWSLKKTEKRKRMELERRKRRGKE